MMHFEFIKHHELGEHILDTIIKLKNQVWPHVYESQMNWVHHNIKDNDIHLLLWDEKALIGYLNIVELKDSINALGIGNVVVAPDRQGENIGYLLMNICDYYLVRAGLPGMLICKDKVLGFYKRCGWSLYNKDVFFNRERLNYNFMTRHFDNKSVDIIQINRIF